MFKRLFVFAGLLTALASHPASAITYPFPVRSAVCNAYLQKIHDLRYINPEDARQYVERQIRRILQRELKRVEVTPAIPSGRFGQSRWAGGMSELQAAGRVKGIEEFSKTSEAGEPGQRNFTKFFVIEGRANIKNALKSLNKDVGALDAAIARDSFNSFKWITAINVLFLSAVNWKLVFQTLTHGGEPVQLMGLGALGLMDLLWKQDFVFARPLFWDYQFGGDLDMLSTSLDKMSDDDWYMVSRNFKLAPRFQREIIHGSGDRDLLEDVAVKQSIAESLSLRDRLTVLLTGRTEEFRSSSWVGIDMILSKNADSGEPTLSLVIRGSEKGPPLPKTATDAAKAENGWLAAPALVPGR